MSKKYLLKVTITPVQEFISEARKVKDLWVGSYLLSMVSYRALEPFINHQSCEIIYPHYESLPVYKKTAGKSVTTEQLQTATTPNQFLVIVPKEKIDELIKASQDNCFNYWQEINKKVKVKGIIEIEDDFIKLWDNQIQDHWQYMWVAIPITDNDLDNNYTAKAQAIQKLLDERKLTRIFNQWQGSKAIKCTQCGHREAMGPEDLFANRTFWEKYQSKKPKYIRKGDRLCAVCLIKRFIQADYFGVPGLSIPSFESTLDIAVKPFRKIVKDNKDNSEFLKSVQDLCRAINTDVPQTIDAIEPEFFYSDELDRTIKGEKASNSVKEKAVDNLKQILNQIKKQHKVTPSRYYAILFADGDNIGKWLTGAISADAIPFTKCKHKEYSKQIAELAVDIANKSNKLGADVIYSGGDDLLAMAGVDNVLQLGVKVREGFKNLPVTTSAGIVFANASEPLNLVLTEGRRALESAKQLFYDKKDAFYISLILSSGIRVLAGYHWFIKKDGDPISVINDVILKLARWLKQNKGLSPQFIYDVLKRLDYYYEYRDRRKEFASELFIDETSRLFKRHWQEESSLPADYKDLIKFLAEMGKGSANKGFDIQENLSGILRITAFLAREACSL